MILVLPLFSKKIYFPRLFYFIYYIIKLKSRGQMSTIVGHNMSQFPSSFFPLHTPFLVFFLSFSFSFILVHLSHTMFSFLSLLLYYSQLHFTNFCLYLPFFFILIINYYFYLYYITDIFYLFIKIYFL